MPERKAPARVGATLLLAVLVLWAVGCATPQGPGVTPVPTAEATDAQFLARFNLQPEGEVERFKVKVPLSWEVPLGAYPEGLYWGLANEFSQDIGLDLTGLKGQTVDVWRYRLAGGLPGDGESSQYHYPSHIILLLKEGQVVGGWLSFNIQTVGPSLAKRSLTDITGLTLEQWVTREHYFADPGKNADLVTMGPVEVLDAFFQAIEAKDKTRANACLSPKVMRSTLTTNMVGLPLLYQPDFNPNNSMVENITHAKLLSYKLIDPGHADEEVQEIGDRTRIEIMVSMELSWRMKEFNTPTGEATRFALLERYPLGWKLEGLGTGP